MAFYSKRFKVPSGKTETNPYIEEISLEEKYITDCWVCFPAGVNWTVGIRIYYGIRKYWPDSPREWIYGSGICIPLGQYIVQPETVSRLKIVAISPEARYPHEIVVMVWTTKEESKPVSVSLVELINYLKTIF